MADQNSTIKTTVVLDATQAQQEIVKLNAIATDTTKSLEERLAAKNQAVEKQNALSKQTIDQLEEEVKLLQGLGAEQKEIEKVQKKLNSERLKATKITENNAKQQAKLASTLADSKNKVKDLDSATGGLLGKFKQFLTNPIGIALAALTAIFTTFKEAVSRSGEASETWNKIGAKLTGILNGILAVLEPVVSFIGEKFLQALENPMQAINDLGSAIQENLINRLEALSILGDSIVALFKGNFSEAAELAKDGFLQLATGVEDADEKFTSFIKSSAEVFEQARTATDAVANSERELLKVRQDLEKQQLTSLRLAEEQRQIRDDISLSFEERIAANEKLGQILEEQLARELQLAQIQLQSAQNQITATGDTIENLTALGDAQLKILEIEERITGQRSEQLVNINALKEEQRAKDEEDLAAKLEQEKIEKEIIERNLAAQIELDELKLEQKRKAGEDGLELEKEILAKQRQLELSEVDLTEKEKQAIIARYKQAEVEVDATANEAKKKSAEAAAAGGIAAAADVFGISQEVAVAQMLMAAPEAIGHSFKEAAKVYAPPWSLAMGALGAAGTVLPIVKGLADIKKTRFSKKKGGSPGGSISTSAATSGGQGGGISPEAINDIAANNAARLGVDPALGQNATSIASNQVQGASSNQTVFSEEKYSEFQNQVQFKEEKTTIG